MENKKLKAEKKVRLLLAIKGRADNGRLLQTLNSLCEFAISVENPRTARDSLRCLRRADHDLCICDQALFSDKLIGALQDNPAPVILLVQQNDDTTQQYALAMHAVHTLVIDNIDDHGLEHYLALLLHYALLHKTHQQYKHDAIASNALAGVYSYRAGVTAEGNMVNEWLSESFEAITGYSVTEVATHGGWVAFINEDDIELLENSVKKLLANEATTFQYRAITKSGKLLWLESHGRPQWSESEQRVVAITGITKDITARKVIEIELKQRADQQAAIAALGEFSHKDPSLKDLFNETVKQVTRTLDAWLCEIYIVHGAGDKAVLRAGAGMTRDLIDTLMIPLTKKNELNYVLNHGDVVTISNLRKESRFKPSTHLREYTAVSGICAPITAGADPIGMLTVFKNEEYAFNENDINFLRSITNILASITAQESTEMRLKSTRQVLEQRADGGQTDDDFIIDTHVESNDHINAIVQSAMDLRARDMIMSATAKATKELFQAAHWEDSIPIILEDLGKAVEASRAYLFETHYDLAGSLLCSQRFEWINSGITSLGSRYPMRDIDLDKLGLARIKENLSRGKYIVGKITDFSKQEQTLFIKQKVQSILLVPIFVDHSWWGFLGFDACDHPRSWTTTEIDALLISANTLGTAIERNQSDNAFKAIIEATAGKSGQDFFDYLVKHLAHGFQADYCLVAEIKELLNCNVHALWEVNKPGKAGNLDINHSPLMEPTNDKVTFYTSDVYKKFPDFHWFKNHNIQSYLGIAVTGSNGNQLGHIAIMHSKSLMVSDRDIEILKVFAARAGMEMERLTIERDNQLLARIPLDSVHLIITTNLQGEIVFNNPVCNKLKEDLKLASVNELLPQTHIELTQQTLQNPGDMVQVESTIGDFIFQWYYHYQQHTEHVDLYAIDITQRHKIEEQLRQDAFHDPLTELPNRAFFNRLLNHAIERTVRRNDYRFAVLFLDLDRFKIVNDSLGHAYGDMLLKQVARVLNECLRPGDYVARFGGDEFAILLDSIEDAREASNIAERIQHMLSKPFLLDKNEAFTSASIGIALSEIGYNNAEEVLRDADIAMYSAKQKGKATHVVFDARMRDEFVHVLKLETDLRRSIKNDELRVYYHPIYSIGQKRVTGFEALVRWQHPEKGLLEPLDFIATAEEMGIIREIDCWVLEVAAQQLKVWRQQFKNMADLKMSINLSAIHFNQMDILAHIGNILKDTKLPPDSLRLELTESVIMQTSNLSAEIFNVLNKRGMHISIDDFGVGYSSLNRLVKLPVDTLKIDRSFINSIVMDTNSLNVTRAVIDLAHDLSLEVIAEGVETSGQFQILGRMGCHYVQGYYIARPLNADEATLFLENPPTF